MEWFEREAIHCFRVVVLVVSFSEHVPLFVKVLLLPGAGVGLNVTRQMRSSNIYLHYSTSIVKVLSLPKKVNKSLEIVRREQYVLIIKCHDLLWERKQLLLQVKFGPLCSPKDHPTVEISYSLQPSPCRWSCHVESRRPIRGRDRDWANRWPDKQASCLALKTQCNACTKASSGYEPPWVVRLCKSSTHEALHRGQLSESQHSRHTKSLPWNVWRDWEY